MKIYRRTSLPDSIIYKGQEYTLNAGMSAAKTLNGTSDRHITEELKKQGRKCIMVEVLAKNLRGRTDLHGRPYKHARHLFTTGVNL